MSQKQMISTTYRYIYSIWKVISDILPRIKYYINRSDKIHSSKKSKFRQALKPTNGHHTVRDLMAD